MSSSTKRLLVHVPLGLVTVALVYASPPIGILFFVGFMVYELAEDWHLKDESYIDIRGYLWGLGTGGGILFLLKVIQMFFIC